MALVTDPKRTFLRDPAAGFRHDGFGHENSQDKPGDKCFRTIPHSGGDLTGRGPIYSAAGSKVAASGWSKGAGWYVVEEATVPGYGTVFPIYFHAAHPGRATDTPTTPGFYLAEIGDTGTGTAPGAFHLHFSVATSLKAALALVQVGNSARRKNESVAQWADRMGLIDPIPFLRAIENTKDSAPAEPKPTDPPRVVIARRRAAMQMMFHGQYLVTFANGAAKFYNADASAWNVYNAMRSYFQTYDFEKMQSHPEWAWVTGTILREQLWAAAAVSTNEARDTVKALEERLASLPKELDGDVQQKMLDTPTALASN